MWVGVWMSSGIVEWTYRRLFKTGGDALIEGRGDHRRRRIPSGSAGGSARPNYTVGLLLADHMFWNGQEDDWYEWHSGAVHNCPF
jgi:hypothetical protein